jgi:hypothetical protein
LTDLNHNFSLIGISETKMVVNKEPIANTSIPGYHFISQPTISNAGGVGI